jgi:hypothetical protein
MAVASLFLRRNAPRLLRPTSLAEAPEHLAADDASDRRKLPGIIADTSAACSIVPVSLRRSGSVHGIELP